MKIKPIFAWYDFWIGVFYDRKGKLYIFPIPCVGIVLDFTIKKYYLHNVHAGYVGNCILFWRKKGAGYTCNLDDAETFSFKAAQAVARRCEQGHFKLREKSDLDKIAERHIDMQDLPIEESSHD